MTPETICGIVAFSALILILVGGLVALHMDFLASQRRTRRRPPFG